MNIEAYKERFRIRLNAMTAEELKNIFEEVLELKKDNIEASILNFLIIKPRILALKI